MNDIGNAVANSYHDERSAGKTIMSINSALFGLEEQEYAADQKHRLAHN